MFKFRSYTLRITLTAVFTALCIVANVFTIDTGLNAFRISFTYIPTMLAGVFLGPLSGFAVGFLGDLMGFLINPFGAYMPLVGIASGLWGLLAGLSVKYLHIPKWGSILLAFVVGLIICTAGLNTYALYIMYSNGRTFWVYLMLRLPYQSIIVAMNCMLTLILYKLLYKVFERNAFKQL